MSRNEEGNVAKRTLRRRSRGWSVGIDRIDNSLARLGKVDAEEPTIATTIFVTSGNVEEALNGSGEGDVELLVAELKCDSAAAGVNCGRMASTGVAEIRNEERFVAGEVGSTFFDGDAGLGERSADAVGPPGAFGAPFEEEEGSGGVLSGSDRVKERVVALREDSELGKAGRFAGGETEVARLAALEAVSGRDKVEIATRSSSEIDDAEGVVVGGREGIDVKAEGTGVSKSTVGGVGFSESSGAAIKGGCGGCGEPVADGSSEEGEGEAGVVGVSGVGFVTDTSGRREEIFDRAEEIAGALPAIERMEGALGGEASLGGMLRSYWLEELGGDGEVGALSADGPGLAGAAMGRSEGAVRELDGKAAGKASDEKGLQTVKLVTGVAIGEELEEMEAGKEIIGVGMARLLIEAEAEKNTLVEELGNPPIDLVR